MITALICCATIILIVLIISYSCVTYYSSDNKRSLISVEEKYDNLVSLLHQKDSMYTDLLKSKEKDLERLAGVIKSIAEKNQNYSVNAKINT